MFIESERMTVVSASSRDVRSGESDCGIPSQIVPHDGVQTFLPIVQNVRGRF